MILRWIVQNVLWVKLTIIIFLDEYLRSFRWCYLGGKLEAWGCWTRSVKIYQIIDVYATIRLICYLLWPCNFLSVYFRFTIHRCRVAITRIVFYAFPKVFLILILIRASTNRFFITSPSVSNYMIPYCLK